MAVIRSALVAAGIWLLSAAAAGQNPVISVGGDSVTIRILNAELRTAVQALGRHLDRPVVFSGEGAAIVTLETPAPVPRADILPLLRSLLRSQGMDLLEEEGAYRVVSQAMPSISVPDPSHEQAGAQTLQLFVIRLRHANAPDVAATINALYGRGGALGEPGAPVSTLSQQLRENRIPPLETALTAQAVIQQPADLSGEVTIVPDFRTNSLLVRSSAQDFELVRAAAEQLDVRPLQVLIEVLIAEIRHDRGFSLGLETTFPETTVGDNTNTRIGGTTEGLGIGDFVLRVRNIGGIDWDMTLRAAAARGDVSILSRPVVFTANNETAQILVGSQRPFVQVQRALPTDAPVRDQVVQYKDVGTQLTVTPTISDDGFVMLEVVQEVNAATNETAFDAPVISTRAVRTQLLVRDGQTAVLGGLADRQREATKAGIPILSRIPVIGWLFGRTTRRTTETELFIFLTPRVVRDTADMDGISEAVRQQTKLLESGFPHLVPPSAPPLPPDTPGQ